MLFFLTFNSDVVLYINYNTSIPTRLITIHTGTWVNKCTYTYRYMSEQVHIYIQVHEWTSAHTHTGTQLKRPTQCADHVQPHRWGEKTRRLRPWSFFARKHPITQLTNWYMSVNAAIDNQAMIHCKENKQTWGQKPRRKPSWMRFSRTQVQEA